MKKTFLYMGVGIFAFLVSLGAVSSFVLGPSYSLETSENVCQKCLDASKTENLETKTLSEIIGNENFYGKKVRLKARFGHDAGYIYFTDSKTSTRSIPASFDENTISCIDTEKTLRVCTGYETWYDSSVDVVVVGYLIKVDKEANNLQFPDFVFNIICIEQVNAKKEELLDGKKKFESSLFNFIELFVSK